MIRVALIGLALAAALPAAGCMGTVATLREGRIAGAGLDVVEGEPAVPPALASDPRVVWSPHIGGHSPDAITAMVRKVRANLDAHFAGHPVLSPVPG